MKKFVAFLSMVALLLSLCACGGQPTKEPTQEEPANRLEEIQARGKIIMATSPDYPPYEFEDLTKSGQEAYVGADIEMAKVIAEELGVDLEIKAMTFDAVLAAVTEGTVDFALAGLAESEERKASMDFTTPYYVEGDQVIIVLTENAENFDTEEELASARLAAQNGTYPYDAMVATFPNADHTTVSQNTDGVLMLREGKIDGLVLPSGASKTFINANDSLTVSPVTLSNFTAQKICAAVVKDEPELLEALCVITDRANEEGLFLDWMSEASALAAELNA